MDDLGIEVSRGRVIRLTYAPLDCSPSSPPVRTSAAPGRCRRATRPWMRQRPSIPTWRAVSFGAEVVTYEDLMAAGTMAEARATRRAALGRKANTRCGTATLLEVLFNVSR